MNACKNSRRTTWPAQSALCKEGTSRMRSCCIRRVVRPPRHQPRGPSSRRRPHAAQARRSCRELLEIDSDKVACADQLYDDLSRHLERCEGELCKFEEELRERGQLKTPANVKASASEPPGAGADSAAGGLSVQVGGPSEMPAPLGTGGRRGRQPSVAAMPDQSPTSHKRGRGRKVSHKEAERQRLAAESAASSAASQSARAEQMLAPHGCGFGCGASPAGGDFGGSFGGGSFGAAPRQEYPDATLPIASREDSNRPLCGAAQCGDSACLDHAGLPPERHRVAAWIAQGCRLDRTGLQPEWHRVAAGIA